VERAHLYESIEKAIQVGTKFHQNQSSGQTDLFGLLDDSNVVEDYIKCKTWTTKVRLDGEKDTLGLYLTGHPATSYVQELTGFVQPIANLNPSAGKKAVICGIINVEDNSAGMDIVVFAEVFEPQQAHINVGQMAVIEGELSQDDYTGGLKMVATALYGVHEARTRFAKCLALTLSANDHPLLPTIQSILKAHQGECVVQIRYANTDATAAINLAAQWRVQPCDELLTRLTEILDERRVEVCY
jgi:DNA polymerase III subunit alpha